MKIKRVNDPRTERRNDAARDKAEKAQALVAYVAMMTDVDLPTDEDEVNENA